MRLPLSVVISSLVFAGCAGKAPAPPPDTTTYISASGEKLQTAPTRADGTIDPKLLAEAKKAGYSLVNTNGELLYCRTDMKLGTHIRKNTDTVCLTQQEMTAMHEQTRHSLEQFVPSHSCSPPNC